jgi:SSS family solute:Na+ symporter
VSGLATGAALWAFVGYLVVVVGVGVWAARASSASVEQYFLAGRKLGRWVVALSAVASGRSSWLLLGLSGLAYARGASAIWAAVGYVAVEFLLFWDYAGRLRRFSERRDCITVPDFFAARFDDRGALRVLIVVVLLVFLPTYVGAQFVAGGKTFASAFGVDATTGVWITSAIVLAYTVLGGFLAVSVTDLLQAFLMIAALVVVPAVALVDLGGWGPLAAALDPGMLDPLAISAGTLIGFLGIGLGSPGNPHILVRYMAIDDPSQLRASAIVGTVWNAVMAFGAVAIGVVGRAAFPDAAALPAGDRENLFAALAADHLHPALLGVALASVFAAIMSTTDSQLLVAASSVVRDLYQKLWRRGRELDERRLVRLSRVVVAALVLLATALGLAGGELVFWFVLLAWAGLGAALGPTSILALYWRRTTRAGAIAGMIAGGGTVYAWRRFFREDLGDLYELVPAFAVGLATTVLVSLFTRPPAEAAAMMREMRAPSGE